MQTENAMVMRADLETIYSLAAGVERWPELLPHYRCVRILQEAGHRRPVEMAAHRDGIPVRWWAVQERLPDQPRITLHDVRGVTTGIDVEWSFSPGQNGVALAIRHDLRLGWPMVGGFVADRIIGPLFVANIPGKTLRRLKQLAEAEAGRA